MAVNNRTEANSKVDIALVPTLTLAQHKTLLKDEINSSVNFRKDVIASDTPSVGAVTVSYLNKDLSTVTTAVDLVVSFSNIENGDVKYLAITKLITKEITFSGATDVSPRRDYITSDITYVIYEVSNKNGTITVNSLNVDNDITSEINTGLSDLYDEIDNRLGGLSTKYIEIGPFDMDNNSFKDIPHGMTSDQILALRCTIIADISTVKYDLISPNIDTFTSIQGSVSIQNPTTIRVTRLSGGLFDSTPFSGNVQNRGYVFIDYLPL